MTLTHARHRRHEPNRQMAPGSGRPVNSVPLSPPDRPHMFVMEVIVRPQDRALCASITCITGIMRPEGRT